VKVGRKTGKEQKGRAEGEGSRRGRNLEKTGKRAAELSSFGKKTAKEPFQSAKGE
jgi:hypothetical protein